MLNEENETMISPYKQAALTLSMIRGHLVNDWVYEQIDHLHNQHHTNNVPMQDDIHWAELKLPSQMDSQTFTKSPKQQLNSRTSGWEQET